MGETWMIMMPGGLGQCKKSAFQTCSAVPMKCSFIKVISD